MLRDPPNSRGPPYNRGCAGPRGKLGAYSYIRPGMPRANVSSKISTRMNAYPRHYLPTNVLPTANVLPSNNCPTSNKRLTSNKCLTPNKRLTSNKCPTSNGCPTSSNCLTSIKCTTCNKCPTFKENIRGTDSQRCIELLIHLRSKGRSSRGWLMRLKGEAR
jgi:hypothetical protein